MPIKGRVSTTLMILGAILTLAVAVSNAEGEQKSATDDSAIRQAVKTYVEAFNKGDAGAVSSLWSDDAEYVNSSGDVFKGRKEIEALFNKFFEENKELKIDVVVSSIRFPSPEEAVETGTANVKREGAPPQESYYVAEYKKNAGEWKLTNVKEEENSDAYEHLKQLGWLIGEWTDQDENASVTTDYQWCKNKSFITGSFTVYIEDKVDLQGTQVIGWDPAAKEIRSWIFDSLGGFGAAVWTNKDNQWTAESKSVLSDGTKASAINIYTYVDDNTYTFQSIGRQVSGKPLPNIDEVTVVRKQPAEAAPQTDANGVKQ